MRRLHPTARPIAMHCRCPREILDALPNRDRSADSDLIEDRASACTHRLLVEPPKALKRRPRRTDLTVEVEVLNDIAMHDQGQVLVDDFDAEFGGALGSAGA